jgi:hypothetical protein
MFVTEIPGTPEEAAAALAALYTMVIGANAAAAPAHTAVVPPAPEDPTAILTALAFQAHHGIYQAMQAEGAAIHGMTVGALAASGVSYDVAEGVNAVML